MASPAVECFAMTRDFGSVRAVDSLTLSIPAGGIFSLLGANGAGKTTTVHLLLGVLEPTSGSARVLGFDPVREGAEIRARAGALLEHHGLYERLSAEENLEFYGRVFRMEPARRAERIRMLLERAGLRDRRHERVGRWSRGMKQKLAIARAVLHEPAFLVLDEPTAGLDPEAAVALRNDIMALAADGSTTVFLNTHNLPEAERLATHVGVMREGRLLAFGTPAELRAQSGGARLRVRGAGWGDVAARLDARPEVISASLEADQTLRINLREDSSAAAVVRTLVDAGCAIEEVTREQPALEDVYLGLMGGAR